MRVSKAALFETLLNGCRTQLFRHALRLTLHHEDAEDLLQDTLVRAFKGFGTFQAGSSFKNWMFRIMANAFKSRKRYDKRRLVIVSYDQSPKSWETEDGEMIYFEFALIDKKHPGKIVLDRLVQAELQETLNGLPEEFRITLILRDVDDYSYNDIAKLLEIPLGTVRSRIFRGRKYLRESLGGEPLLHTRR